MSNVAIRVEGLSKQYRIGARQERYRTLRDTLTDVAVGPFRRLRSILRGHGAGLADGDSTIWALKEVSFEIKRGEVLGIIGPNGAGKTTLLKILSRITDPTQGYADVYGRVGTLLEVGTGFHNELTGRENIFLSGAILGMRRSEIGAKFDEIVAFAEVEKFIDTPVKHYSTGMYLRLAFAVAAHLEPEILLVDEVLAVGDAAFQEKCLGKMRDVARVGRTVVFVSHNLAAILALCQRSLVLSVGRMLYLGNVSDGVAAYHDAVRQAPSDVGVSRPPRCGQIVLRQPSGRRVDVTAPFTAQWDVWLPTDATSAKCFCVMADAVGTQLVRLHHTIRRDSVTSPASRTWEISVRFPPLWLKPGNYTLQLRVYPNGLGKEKRYFSDPFLFEAASACSSFGPALLAPLVSWDVQGQDADGSASDTED